MRKITKICDLSTVYKQWEEDLEANNTDHPKWEDSTTRNNHYLDLKMQLLRCQGGICIYSEQRLCPLELLTDDKWQEGKYIYQDQDKQAEGDVEHFDDKLKKAPFNKAWLWDNLFMAHHTINTRKSTKSLDLRLKPTNSNFDPFYLFDYDCTEHEFRPNENLVYIDKSLYDAVKDAINVLSLNSIKWKRKKNLICYAAEIFVSNKADVYEYPTAWEFWQRQQNEKAHHQSDNLVSPDEYE